MERTHFLSRKAYIFGVCLFLLFYSCQKRGEQNNEFDYTALKGKEPLEVLELQYKHYLKEAFESLDKLISSNSDKERITNYKDARKWFKYAEPILSFVDKNNYSSLDAPNIIKVLEEDATDIKIKNPFGFQVIEELLFEEEKDIEKIKRIAKKTSSRLKLLHNNTKLRFKKYHILWLVRNQIIRIATTGITGFDSPVLSQSLYESSLTYEEILNTLNIYQDSFSNKTLLKAWEEEINLSKDALKGEFDTFDRFSFIRDRTNKQLELMIATQQDWKVKFNVTLALNHKAKQLFSEAAFNMTYFSDYRFEVNDLETKIALGKQLFNDKRLSTKNNISCASCHIKSKAFTDGKVTFDAQQIRNTPTITYSALQQSFFHDARGGSLEGQIVSVVNNHGEFNTDLKGLEKEVNAIPEYKTAFDTLYTRKGTEMNIRHALASYVRSLNSFDSKFDNNINGLENTLTVQEKNGFNLFMGKAVCATCHFPPVFNGTIPPNFKETELEIIGVPDSKANKKLDDDFGAYNMFHTEERKGSFKTPSIRNIALTAPYMHNGVYNTLEEVINFYNKGGGEGLGYKVPNQTLPFDKLDLSESEIKDLIAFMKTLTDDSFEKEEY